MNKSTKLLLTAIAALFLVNISAVNAATDTVMLVTDMTSVDAATASAAAGKAGVPVLVLENGLLTDAIKSELQAQGFKTVVLVGGPVVIKPQVETELRRLGYNVVRLWGFERTGTAVAVARYFWPEGSGCAVLVDDTKNSDEDSPRQLAASNLAARFNCTLVPVPEGTVPAEVLAVMQELNVSRVHFVGKRVSLELREKLRNFALLEITGSHDEVENEVEDEITNATRKPKLVIVATPDWKAAIAIGANPNERSVVKHLSNTSQVPEVITFIQEHNITDVRVVGLPGLVQQIADLLSAAGINVTKISGQRASEIAREVLKRVRAEWNNESATEEANKLRYRLRIRAYLEEQLNKTLAELDAALTELDAMAAAADTTAAKAAIEAAKARISEVRTQLASGNYDAAQRLLFELRFKADEKRFELRDRLRIRIAEHIKDEEEDVDDAQSDADENLAAAETRLSQIRARCANAEIVDAIIAKAKLLRTSIQQAKESGNFTSASQHLVQVRELVRIAHSIAEACGQSGNLSVVAKEIVMREGIPSIEIVKPEDGSTVAGRRLEVAVKIANFRLVAPTNAPRTGEGHVHAYLDGTEQRGPATSFVFENVTAGQHTVRAELHLSDHTLVEGAIDKISITTATSEGGSQGSSAYTIEADDNGFYRNGEKITLLSVPTNTDIKITFQVRTTSVYFAGLEFRSSEFNTGRVEIGSSKEVSFNTETNFTVTSYWPATSTKKADLRIAVA